MSNKYSNGMYKVESKSQTITSQAIFTAFKDNGILDYMSIDFNQKTGNCIYEYHARNKISAYYVEISRDGKIMNSGFIA